VTSGSRGVAAVPVDRPAAEAWISAHVAPAGPIEPAHEQPWSTVLRVPLAGGTAWFKACSSVQGFEPRLTAALHARWPELVPEVLGFDERRGWLLLADAGTRIGDLGNLPEFWIDLLPRYAELQRGEAARADEHLAHGVPDLRVATLAERYDELLAEDLPVSSAERRALMDFAPTFGRLCSELASHGPADSVQHDDLHMHNVYRQGNRLRVLDWGDSSISHPFVSLVATFRFLEERNGLAADDPSVTRVRDAYLEGWGTGLAGVFDLAMRVGGFAHAIAELRQRRALSGRTREDFDRDVQVRLRRALRRVDG
jgi:hypothetical protein